MKNFEHQVWSINAVGVLSRLAGFNVEDAAREFRDKVAKAHPQGTTVVVVSGGEITSSAVGSRVV